MSKIILLASTLFLFSLASCSSESENVTGDTLSADSLLITAPSDSSVVEDKNAISTVEMLVPKLPLLKFPLVLNVDSFQKKEGVLLQLKQNLPWFSEILEFPSGTKVSGMGKFYVNAKTIAVLFLTTSSGESPERPEEVQLVLSLFDIDNGTIDSRILAITSAEAYGNSIMKNPNTGKSFVNQEAAEINVTLQDFKIKDGQFVLGDMEDKIFSGDQKGRDSSVVVIEEFMK